MIAFGFGSLIGRVRGGRWQGVTSTRLHAKGALIFGITTTLVLSLIGPAFPIAWLLIGYASFLVFGLKNLQITGMIVLLIGLMMNVAPALANGAVPVSERALVSVGAADANGVPDIDGVRESSTTATSFSTFGDVVPVPLFNTVVSLGDLVILVALADIAANLTLRARRRQIDGSVMPSSDGDVPQPELRVPVLSPLSRSFLNRPAHAAHRRPRTKTVEPEHEPAHAVPDATEPVIILDGPTGYIEQPPPPSSAMVDAPEVEPAAFSTSADHRPIIDLTTSPSDEQLCEFLRRRETADAQLDRLAPPSPGHRRNRGRLRRQRTVSAESDTLAESSR